MKKISNPTAGAAIGAVDKEIGRAVKCAEYFRKARLNGTFNEKAFKAARQNFHGLFRIVFDREFNKPPEDETASEN